MKPDERLRINVALYRRFLGHEEHEIRSENNSESIWCHTCHRETGRGYIPDLTSDGNAMLAMADAVRVEGYDVSIKTIGTQWLVYIFDTWSGQSDTLPEALALAAMKLPEDSHAD